MAICKCVILFLLKPAYMIMTVLHWNLKSKFLWYLYCGQARTQVFFRRFKHPPPPLEPICVFFLACLSERLVMCADTLYPVFWKLTQLFWRRIEKSVGVSPPPPPPPPRSATVSGLERHHGLQGPASNCNFFVRIIMKYIFLSEWSLQKNYFLFCPKVIYFSFTFGYGKLGKQVDK